MAKKEDLKGATEEAKNLNKETERLIDSFNSLGFIIRQAIEDAIESSQDLDTVAKKVAKTYERDIAGAVKKTTLGLDEQLDLQRKLNSGQNIAKDIAKIREKQEQAFTSIQARINILRSKGVEISDDLVQSAKKQADIEREVLNSLQDQNKEMVNSMGLTGRLIEGMGGFLQKLGLSSEASSMITESLEGARAAGGGLGGFIKGFAQNIMAAIKPVDIIVFLLLELKDALKLSDQLTGDLAKSMGVSYDESLQMVDSMNNVANLSGETYVTTEKLVKSQMALSKAFGTNAQLSGELLKDYTQITEQAGYSAEAATSLGKITQATGGDLSKNTASILGAATAFNATNKLALNEKEIVEEVAKTGAATVLTFGKSAKALANNVLEAKKFGLNLEQASKISEGLLNFQSSIESELEAELLTGKQLNFEQARFLALQGETGAAAAEVAKQIGGSAEFGKMNVIQQEALAKSVGLSRDELAQSILDREVLAKLGAKEGTAQDAYNKLKKQGLSDDAIAAKLGDEKLASQLKSQSVQERFNASIDKMREIFVSVAEPILAIVSPLMDLATSVLPVINMVLQPILFTFKLISNTIGSIIGFITQSIELMSALAAGTLTYLTLKNKALIVSKGELAIEFMRNTAQKAGLGISTAAEAIKSKGLLKTIAEAAMSAFASVSKIPFVGPVLGVAAAAAAAALGYKYMSKADDLMSPGYGKRTLTAPEGTYALNDKDTIIAGTDLNKGGNSPTSSPSIDLSPLLAKMDQMNTILNQLLTKEGTVTLDGNKVGQALSMGSYKMQ